MNRNRWIIFAAVCVAVFGFLVYQGGSSRVAFEGDPAKVVAGDNVYGDRDSEVVLIEYGDFQCPGCGALQPVLKEVKDDYEDTAAIVYRHLPITTIHPHAKTAAISAQAAARQDKFWEMHDLIFENQDSWSNAPDEQVPEFFANYAEGIGLDMEQYRQDIEKEEVAQRVERDVAAAQKAGFQLSTPILVLNGEKLELSRIQTNGQYDEEKLRNVLNEALRDAGVEPPQEQEQDAESSANNSAPREQENN